MAHGWTHTAVATCEQSVVHFEERRVHWLMQFPKRPNHVDVDLVPRPQLLAKSIGRISRIAGIRIPQVDDLMDQTEHEVVFLFHAGGRTGWVH